MKKRNFVVDLRNPTETLMKFSRCNGYYKDVWVLEKKDGTFVIRGEAFLKRTEKKIKNLKVLRKGCLVRIVNPYNEFNGKKLSVYDISGEMVTVLTHTGKMTVSAGNLKVLK